MPNIERQFYFDPSHILGYYSSDGTPLAFATRKTPGGGDQRVATVHADKPIAPGASMFLIRRELRIDKKATDSKSQKTIGLGNFALRGRENRSPRSPVATARDPGTVCPRSAGYRHPVVTHDGRMDQFRPDHQQDAVIGHLHAPLTGDARVNSATASQCAVWGNISNGVTRSSL